MAVEKYVLKRVDVWSLTKIFTIFGLIWGLITGIILLPVIAFAGSASQMAAQYGTNVSTIPSGTFFAAMGVFILIIAPILGAVGGLISGVIYGFLYNMSAGWIGGIKIELDKKTPHEPLEPQQNE